MKRQFTHIAAILAVLVTTGRALEAPADEGLIRVGNGVSSKTDPKAAGVEAAALAKSALGCGCTPKAVLVFDQTPATPEAKKAMLEGIATIFPKRLIHGCSAYAPITDKSNTGTVGVMAIGGKVTVSVAVANLTGGHESCGKRLGESLKAASKCDAKGKLAILVGSSHYNSNDQLVKGVHGVLGDEVKLAGGAASKGELVYYQGELVREKSNIGVLLCGPFSCSFAAGEGKKPQVAQTTAAAAKKARAEAVGQPIFALVCDCGGRRGWFGQDIANELDLIKAGVGDMPIFGFYGSGETGPKDNQSPPRGVGYTIFVCIISAVK